MTGQKFGLLTVVGRDGSEKSGARWLCVCECGGTTTACRSNLVRGNKKSCGCKWTVGGLLVKKHGQSGTRAYKAWTAMKQRCNNPKSTRFADYGGRGIGVCERWNTSFESFLADMGQAPTNSHTIERLDNNVGYEPTNCKWVLMSVQANNKRTTRRISMTLSITQWANLAGMSVDTLRHRLEDGSTLYEALTTDRFRPQGRRPRSSIQLHSMPR